jgi:PKD repeat protein
MNKQINLTSLILVAIVLVFTQCKKNEMEFIGTPSKADFSFFQSPASDTLPYAYKVGFTNNSQEGFLYQWNFGDNSALTAETSPIHEYKTGGVYNVTLTSVGTYGNNSITKVISVFSACDNELFDTLTSCSYAEWSLVADVDAIKIIASNGSTIISSTAAKDCQLDDVYKFSANGDFAYDASGQTYNQQTSSCAAPRANANNFKLVVTPGLAPKIILGNVANGMSRPFIGTTDSVTGNTYEVVSFAGSNLIVRGQLSNMNYVEVKLQKKRPLTLVDIQNILTGGSSRSWKLDPTAGANSIVVGTEGNPAEYYSGGPLADCQIDDVYSFSSGGNVNYNSGGATFNGGNIAPNYNCGADRSFSCPYTFTAVSGSAGLAQMTLPGAIPVNFIGTTDVPENFYRIIDITPNRMTLRAGSGSGVVFQFKFVRQ